MRPRVFLFLDFDGVLHPVSARPEARWASVGPLAELVATMPDVMIVISSTYRSFMQFDSVLELFPSSMRERIVGGTPVIDGAWGDTRLPRRQREIYAWLLGNGHAQARWLAVDDDFEHFEEGCQQLFLVDEAAGLTRASIEQLRVRLQSES